MALQKLIAHPRDGGEVEYWKIGQVDLTLTMMAEPSGIGVRFQLWGFRDADRRFTGKAPALRQAHSLTAGALGLTGAASLDAVLGALYGWLKAQPEFAGAADV